MCVAAITHGNGIQFYSCRKDASYDNKVGLGGSVVISLSSKLSLVHDCNYHLVMDNFFTSPRLLRELKMKGMAGTGKDVVEIALKQVSIIVKSVALAFIQNVLKIITKRSSF